MKNRAFDHSNYENWIDPNLVTPYDRNSKIHTDKQIKAIVKSIKDNGWQQDTVLTRDNVCVIGHGRRLAALEIGCEMPYHRVDKDADQLTEKEIRRLRYIDNKINAMTGFDYELEALEIEDLDFDGFDFDFSDGVNGGGQTETSIPENLDGEDYDADQPLAVKITFQNYTAYSMYEDEIKETAVRMGAVFSVIKA